MAIIYKHRHQPLPALPETASRWQSIVATLLAKNPTDRYASAVQAEAILQEAAQQARAVAA